jgi:ribosome maturation factor RimP
MEHKELWQIVEGLVNKEGLDLYDIVTPKRQRGFLKVYIYRKKPLGNDSSLIDNEEQTLVTPEINSSQADVSSQQGRKNFKAVGHEDCVRVSKRILNDPRIEVILPGDTELEVSTPGINRELKKYDHVLQALGERVAVTFKERLFLQEGALQDNEKKGRHQEVKPGNILKKLEASDEAESAKRYKNREEANEVIRLSAFDMSGNETRVDTTSVDQKCDTPDEEKLQKPIFVIKGSLINVYSSPCSSVSKSLIAKSDEKRGVVSPGITKAVKKVTAQKRIDEYTIEVYDESRKKRFLIDSSLIKKIKTDFVF